jgi:hypothetical protein
MISKIDLYGCSFGANSDLSGIARLQHDFGKVATPPWHYTTFLDLLDHWQSLLAGILALLAAIIAVVVTIGIERRKLRYELTAIRASLAVEFRVILARAYGAHELIKKLAQQTDSSITSRQLKSLSHMPVPIIYRANAGRVGLLGEGAMDVVQFYGVIEVVCAKADELQQSRTPDDISRMVIAGLADGFLTACENGLRILPQLKTAVQLLDERDVELIGLIHKAALARAGPQK